MNIFDVDAVAFIGTLNQTSTHKSFKANDSRSASITFIGGRLLVTDCVVLLGWSRNSMPMPYFIGFPTKTQDIFHHLVTLVNDLTL
jgi:hypothetical protein